MDKLWDVICLVVIVEADFFGAGVVFPKILVNSRSTKYCFFLRKYTGKIFRRGGYEITILCSDYTRINFISVYY